MQQRSSKAQLEQHLIKIWGLSDYPTSISHAVFEVVWLKVNSKIEIQGGLPSIDDLVQEGYYVVEIVNICRKVYGNEVNKVNDIKSVFKHLNNLHIEGDIKLSKGVMGRDVIEWNYSINSIRILRMRSSAIIRHELLSVKHRDIRLMLGVIQRYNYQVEEEWIDVDRGSISCYIGSRVN